MKTNLFNLGVGYGWGSGVSRKKGEVCVMSTPTQMMLVCNGWVLILSGAVSALFQNGGSALLK